MLDHERRIVEKQDCEALMEALTAMYYGPDRKALLRGCLAAGWMRGAAIVAASLGGDAWMEFVEDMRGRP